LYILHTISHDLYSLECSKRPSFNLQYKRWLGTNLQLSSSWNSKANFS